MLTPLKDAGTIDTIFNLDCVIDKEARQGHIDSAVKRGLPWCVKRTPREGKVAIVASGPSANEYVDLLKDWDGEVWGINGAFAWLMHRRIKPSAFVGLDPEPILTGYFTATTASGEVIHAPTDATYYLGAQVHPEVFDYLEGKNVRLWFPADTEVEFPFGAVPIYGGSTCLGRAPNLAYHLGWREVHIFGCDSSFTHKTHVYGGELPPNAFICNWHGREFWTTRQFMQQACEFVEQMVEWARPGADGDEPLSVSLYGDGLTQAMFAASLEAGGYQQYLREAYQNGFSRKEKRAIRMAMRRMA